MENEAAFSASEISMTLLSLCTVLLFLLVWFTSF